MKETFYFSHDYNARNDQKILMLRGDFGAEGYGIFWMCIESMAEEENGYIYRGAIGGLSVSYNYPKEKLEKLVDYCIKIGIFEENEVGVFSPRLKEHKDFRAKLSKAGKDGAKKRWGGYSHPNAKERKGKENSLCDKSHLENSVELKESPSLSDQVPPVDKKKTMYEEPTIEIDENGDEIEAPVKEGRKTYKAVVLKSLYNYYTDLFNIPKSHGLYIGYIKTLKPLIDEAQKLHGDDMEKVEKEIKGRMDVAKRYCEFKSWDRMKISTILENWNLILDKWNNEVE